MVVGRRSEGIGITVRAIVTRHSRMFHITINSALSVIDGLSMRWSVLATVPRGTEAAIDPILPVLAVRWHCGTIIRWASSLDIGFMVVN
jgi:hypothetical protein